MSLLGREEPSVVSLSVPGTFMVLEYSRSSSVAAFFRSDFRTVSVAFFCMPL